MVGKERKDSSLGTPQRSVKLYETKRNPSGDLWPHCKVEKGSKSWSKVSLAIIPKSS